MKIDNPNVISNEWKYNGNNFIIIVKHYNNGYNPEKNYWNVYCYIYPIHPLFEELEYGIYESGNMPFHSGCSFCDWHYDKDKKLTSKQYGSDYNHLYDDIYLSIDNKEDAKSVFYDARELFRYLTKTNKEE